MDRREQLLTINQVSQKLNIPKPTLRFWEKELEGILAPYRTEGRQRRYTFEHISVINKIQRYKKEGLGLTEIKERLNNDGIRRRTEPNSDGIDCLADRIAEVVRLEVCNFFQNEG
jgi:DNA-binding transcriptional MerR regulator